MAAPDFFLAFDLSGSQPTEMVRDLISRILTTAGCHRDASPKIIEGLEAAIEKGHGTCHVTFQARNNHLEVSASAAGVELWQITQSLV